MRHRTECNLGTCAVIDTSIPDSNKAMWTLESISNFNDFLRMYWDGLNNAQSDST